MFDSDEVKSKREKNAFNKYFNTNYYVNDNNDVVIKGIMSRMIFSEEEQQRVIKEIDFLSLRKTLGEEPTFLEQLAIQFLFDSTY